MVDALDYTLATTAVKFSGVGDYPITVTLGSNPNYSVTPTDGNLHINQKAATVTLITNQRPMVMIILLSMQQLQEQ
jgi:hypothetical protein